MGSGDGDVAGIVAHFLPRESRGDEFARPLGKLALAEPIFERLRQGVHVTHLDGAGVGGTVFVEEDEDDILGVALEHHALNRFGTHCSSLLVLATIVFKHRILIYANIVYYYL